MHAAGARNITLNLLNAISDRNRNCETAVAIAFPACRCVGVHRISRPRMRTASPSRFVIKRVGECWRPMVERSGVWIHKLWSAIGP